MRRGNSCKARRIADRPWGLYVFLVGLLLVLSSPQSAMASGGANAGAGAGAGAARVSAALNTMDNWLATSAVGYGWSEFLLTNELRMQLANGDHADSAIVAHVLQRYESGENGLNRWRFVAVRDALQDWSDQLALQSVENLAVVVRSTEVTHAYTDQEVQVAKSEARQALDNLNRFLSQSPSRALAWKDFLHWDEIEEQLSAASPEVRKRLEIIKRLSSAEDGLGLPEFKNARESLSAYFDRQQTAAMDPEQFQREMKNKLNELSGYIGELGPEATQRQLLNVGRHLTFIDRYANAPSVGRLTRRRFSHPNLVGYASEPLLNRAVSRAIHEPGPISDTILGARIRGHGITDGQVNLTLEPNRDQGAFVVSMHGVNNARTVGSAKKVYIHTRSTTQLNAGTRILFTPDTGISTGRTNAWAHTQSSVLNITTSRRLQRMATRIAWKKVGQQKPQAERIGSQMATDRLRTQFGEQVQEMIQDSNRQYHAKLRKPLISKDLYPDKVNVSTTENAVYLFAQKAFDNQLAAPVAATPPPGGHDAAVTVHESLVNNIAAHFLGGRTLSNKDADKASESDQLKKLQKMVEISNLGEPPEDKKDAPWQVTLASANPVSVEFRDHKIRVTVRGTEFVGVDEETVYKRNMNIWGLLGVGFGMDGSLVLTLEKWDVEPTAVEKNRENNIEGGFQPADALLRSKLRVRLTDLLGSPASDMLGDPAADKPAADKPASEKQVVIMIRPIKPEGEVARLGTLVYTLCQPEKAWLTLALDRSHKIGALPSRPKTVVSVRPVSVKSN